MHIDARDQHTRKETNENIKMIEKKVAGKYDIFEFLKAENLIGFDGSVLVTQCFSLTLPLLFCFVYHSVTKKNKKIPIL